MSHAVTPAPPIVVNVPVILTAIVRPEPNAGGYSASIPALPGCHTQGETLDEVRANLREAAEGWLAVAHEDAIARDTAGGAPVKIISGKRMCRVLEGRGSLMKLPVINGSHHVYRHIATGRRTVVPVHGNQDLKPGIMRDAELTEDVL